YDTSYPSGSLILEAGCGVGAQTVTLASRSGGAAILSMDISAESLAAARQGTRWAENVMFLQADLYALPFHPESFDHVFVCFVLEDRKSTRLNSSHQIISYDVFCLKKK